MSDCCLTPTEQFFTYHGENKLIFNEMMNMLDEGDSESERYKLIFNERMNMRDEGDSGSERYTS